MDTPPTIQARLTLAIDATGLSDREVARLAKLSSEAHVGMIRRGNVADPKGPTLGAIAEALGISAGWLTFGEGNAPDDAALRELGESVKAAARAAKDAA